MERFVLIGRQVGFLCHHGAFTGRHSAIRIQQWILPASCIPYTLYTTRPVKGKNTVKGSNVKAAKTEDMNPAIDDIVDEKVTFFHKPTSKIINVRLNKPQSQVTLHFQKSKNLVNLSHRSEPKESVIEKNTVKDLPYGLPKLRSIDEHMWSPIGKTNLTQLPLYYLKLSKDRLTALVVLTAMAGYAMSPGAFNITTFMMCSVGTGLTSASANAINQYLEVPYDSQMNRTKNRVIVRGHISPLHAVGFGVVTGVTGLLMLGFGVNSLTAGLGALNLGIYTMAYTPLKRLSIVNTWVGSIVGAIPPMMGWAACAGTLDSGAWLLAAILYAWQFPHFNSLSWNLRGDYSRAGYRMMAVVNPALCKRVAFRYSIGMIGLCSLAPVLELTTWGFAVDSLPVNLYGAYLGYKFYKDGDSQSSRKLFRFSLVQIPLILVLMFISKKKWGDGHKKKPTDVTQKDTVSSQ